MEYKKQTLQDLKAMRESENDTIKASKVKISAIDKEILSRTGDNLGMGTRNHDIDNSKVKVTVPKKVTWDQVMLSNIYNNILKADDDPSQYIKVTYAIEENKYKAWPEHIKNKFKPARTESEGTAKVEVK